MAEPTISVRVKAGEPFEVQLEGKATSGYLWEVRDLPPEVDFLGSGPAMPEGGGSPGEPARQVLRFRVVHPGQYELRLNLKRSWEAAGITSRLLRIQAS